MKKLLEVVPMSAVTVSTLRRSLSPVRKAILRLEALDTRWEASLEGGGKCVWTTDGHRVEFELISGGGYVGARSKVPDELYPGREP